MRSRLSGLSPLLALPAAVALFATVLLIIFGVHPLEILRFAAYEGAFVFLPGWLLYLVLNTTPRSLAWQVAVGWTLGYILEILAFVATSSLGIRSWFVGYPVIVVVLVPLAWLRHGGHARRVELGSRRRARILGIAVLCALALSYVGAGYFTETPLPETAESVSYYPDIVWALSLAAEAENHWPITDPHVAGEPLSYYTFVFLHLAAVGQVTGLPLPLILFRLYIIPLLVLLVVQLFVLGRMLGSNRRVGLLTVILALFVGEIDPFPRLASPFLHVFFRDLYLSPTFLLGLICFIPLVLELSTLLNSSAVALSQSRNWLLVSLLLVGCGGAKGSILPVIAGGLALYLAWDCWAVRRTNLPALLALGLTLVTLTAFFGFMYGNSGIGASVHPLASIYAMQLFSRLSIIVPDATIVRLLFVFLFVIVAFLGLMGIRAVGLAGLLWRERARLPRTQAWLMSLFLISLVPYYGLGQHGQSQIYFFWYGYVACCALAAYGLSTWDKVFCISTPTVV
jgi:hypothetical protein